MVFYILLGYDHIKIKIIKMQLKKQKILSCKNILLIEKIFRKLLLLMMGALTSF